MNLSEEHPTLHGYATRLLDHLDIAERSLVPIGDVQHFLHNQLTERCALLGHTLRAAVILEADGFHAPALGLLRVALEHHVFDLLLFGADRIERKRNGVSPEDWARIEARLKTQDDVIASDWKNGTLTVIRQALRPHGDVPEDERYVLSPYFVEYTQHDPFIGPSDEQAHLAGQFAPLISRQGVAQHYEDMRRGRLGWDNLRRNLRLNELVSGAWLRQVQVHYRFLGAYVHPTSERAEQIIYGRSHPPALGRSDHFISELVLLYAITIACSELRALIRFTRRPPAVSLESLEHLEELLSEAEEEAAYFWFPGGTPDWYDRVEEANHRGVDHSGETLQLVPREKRKTGDIPVDEIPYYRNPLERLQRMHRNANEMTGFPFMSVLACADHRRGV